MSTSTSTAATLSARVTALRWLGPESLMLELRPADGGLFPPFEAGAHIQIVLAPLLTRHYSLLNDPADRSRYLIAVHRVRHGGPGSHHVHEQLRPGHLLAISQPRNNFALDEDAPHTVLLGGGIGITPLLAMAHRLTTLDRPWTLWHAVRSRHLCGFERQYERWNEREAHRVHLHVDDESGGPLDIAGIVAQAPKDAHFYACGPAPMLDAYLRCTAALDPARVHLERFSAPPDRASVSHAADQAFEIVLARSGRRLSVPSHRSMLDVLLDHGIDAPYSCTEGFCGSCRTGVLSGTPDHRDSVLSDAERRGGQVVMVCVSRCLSPELALDL